MRATGKTHKDIYRAFYTQDDDLASYMVRLLNPQQGRHCLEPSAGSGHFITALLKHCPDVEITALEISKEALKKLHANFSNYPSVHICEQDFLSLDIGLFDDGIKYDYLIANPPYGAWQEYDRREWLKQKFDGLYVKESYGLFVALGLEKVAEGGRAVFILPETFLYVHMQKILRERLLRNYAINSIDIFPSSLFPGVSFGYAKLCIISIDKKTPDYEHAINIRRCNTISELVGGIGVTHKIKQASILNRDAYTFPLGGYDNEAKFIDNASTTLGDVAKCVTGIYSGNDQLFVRRASSNPRGATKYSLIDPEKIGQISACKEPLTGLPKHHSFLPMLKGGGVRYFKPVMWYLDWSKEAVSHYKTDKKARFQNSTCYFKKGIGFPMVSSGGASASIIRQDWIFDQSVVGIFPNNNEHYWYLLAFLNSPTCWTLLRKINPSTNNSAKYIKRLPIVIPNAEELKWFENIVSEYVFQLESGQTADNKLENIIANKVAEIYRPEISGQ